jgi:hypothetical protein
MRKVFWPLLAVAVILLMSSTAFAQAGPVAPLDMTELAIIGIANTVILSLITAFGPSTHSFQTIPAAWRAVIASSLSIVAGTLQFMMDHNSTWKSAILTAIAAGIGGLFKVLIEAFDGNTEAAKKAKLAVKVAKETAVRSATLLLLLMIVGCAGSFEEAKLAGRTPEAIKIRVMQPSDYCASLDSKHATWQAIGVGSGVLAGASGLTSIPVKGDDLKLGLAIGSVAFATLGATAAIIADRASTSWARDCSERGDK